MTNISKISTVLEVARSQVNNMNIYKSKSLTGNRYNNIYNYEYYSDKTRNTCIQTDYRNPTVDILPNRNNNFGSNYHWCAVFIYWVMKYAKALQYYPEFPNIYMATGCENLFKSFESQGFYTSSLDKNGGLKQYTVSNQKRVLRDAQSGDIVFYAQGEKNRYSSHVGIISSIGEDQDYIVTYEGNTTPDGETGSQSAGGQVAKKRRTIIDGTISDSDNVAVFGIARPKYGSQHIPNVGQPMPDFPLPSGWVFAKGGYQSYNGITDDWGPYIEFIQEALNLIADGRFGEATHQAVLAFQAQRGLSQDGKVGRNTWNALREKRDGGSSSGGSSSGYDDGSTYTGAFKLPSGHCYGKLGIAYASHNGHENASDRPAIRGIQRKLGLSADGLFGNGTHNTVVSFQTKYGLIADGKVGPSTWRSIIFNTDGGSVYGGDSFLLPRGHCYGKLGINYASHNGYENSSDRPAIRKIQQRLGLYSDGLFGSGTHSAVVAFQRSRGLTADGKVGPGTWNKMF